jgi:hypothetical protein
MDVPRALLRNIVDYAGLFPPAGLGMTEAVRNYAQYRRGEHRWMLGPFVLPVARLDELVEAMRAEGESSPNEPWPLSVLSGPDPEADAAALDRFDREHGPAAGGLARIEAVELKLSHARMIEGAHRALPSAAELYFELPWDEDRAPWFEALRQTGSSAKMRTGGISPELFPSVQELARFLAECRAHEVAFKATAGLHHPLRSEHPLSYEPGAPQGTMHGFLNVFAAAVLGWVHALGPEELEPLLRLSDPTALRPDENGIAWAGHAASVAEISSCRRHFARSFGSCSFTEPVHDLQSLGWI